MTNKPVGTLYIGISNNIERRGAEHKYKLQKGYTYKYTLNKLVYVEIFSNVNQAIAREKQLKNWHRQWKINLIESNNPTWHDLSVDSRDSETSSE